MKKEKLAVKQRCHFGTCEGDKNLNIIYPFCKTRNLFMKPGPEGGVGKFNTLFTTITVSKAALNIVMKGFC